MTDLDHLTGTEALRLAGFGHRRTSRTETTQQHEVYRLDTGEVVATLTAHEAHAFARAAIDEQSHACVT